MTHMTTADASSFLPYGRALTRADLEAMPSDDGHRYELIDGVLIVSPSPRHLHQRVAARLHLILHAAAANELEVLFAPFDVVLANDTVIQPDLIAAPMSDFTERDLPTAPLLAVEVLSPSTRGVDLMLKRERLQRAGCPHYWLVDPDEPSVTALALYDGAYRETAHAAADETFCVTAPFPVSFTPTSLVD